MIKNKFFSLLFFLFSFAANAQTNEQEIDDSTTAVASFYNNAVLQGLNKNTAKTSILEVGVGNKIQFGTLNIIVHKCWQAPLDQRPESKILMEVFEDKFTNGKKSEKRIFYGWIFASSPSVSGLEHPIYDLTAAGCK